MRRKHVSRKKWYPFLCERDGERCRICGRTPPIVYLEIDHIDGKKHHNPSDGSNYQLLCRSHNRRKNPRGKTKYNAQSGIPILGRELTPEMETNQRAWPSFCHWLYDTMKLRGKMPVKEIIFEGGIENGCSPATIRDRYLPMVTAPKSKKALFRRYHDDLAGIDMVCFKDSAALGISPVDYFVDDQPIERE